MDDSWFELRRLTHELAWENRHSLVELLNRIPLVTHSVDDLMSDTKDDFPLTEKWQESLVAVCDERPVGLLLTHVRQAEAPLYPSDSFYLAGLAVAADVERRGVATSLVTRWLAETAGSVPVRSGAVQHYSLQTNSASRNAGVQALYKSFGFVAQAKKHYDNRVDLVMFRPIALKSGS